MKIVIDIQDDVYRVLKEDIYPIPDIERLAIVFKVLVKKGIPLDKIRSEIKNDWQLKRYPSSPFSCGLKRAIEIIDKYRGK